MEKAVASWAAGHPGKWLRALLLGVTPDIAKMRWPEASSLMAVDNSMAMAHSVWPGNANNRLAVCANWLALPRRESSCDVVAGDGSINCLKYPDGFRAFAEKIRGVLTDDGILVLRCYVQPVSRELPEQVFADLGRSKIPSFHHFKFRLLMALQPSTEQGIAVNDVYERWAQSNIDQRELMFRTGWEKRAIKTIEIYRGKETVHTFPTLTELRAALHEFFEETSVSIPSYALGERCPSLVLRKRQ